MPSPSRSSLLSGGEFDSIGTQMSKKRSRCSPRVIVQMSIVTLLAAAMAILYWPNFGSGQPKVSAALTPEQQAEFDHGQQMIQLRVKTGEVIEGES